MDLPCRQYVPARSRQCSRTHVNLIIFDMAVRVRRTLILNWGHARLSDQPCLPSEATVVPDNMVGWLCAGLHKSDMSVTATERMVLLTWRCCATLHVWYARVLPSVKYCNRVGSDTLKLLYNKVEFISTCTILKYFDYKTLNQLIHSDILS